MAAVVPLASPAAWLAVAGLDAGDARILRLADGSAAAVVWQASAHAAPDATACGDLLLRAFAVRHYRRSAIRNSVFMTPLQRWRLAQQRDRRR